MTIALIGLPGSGKSSVGRRLAAILGCDFVDVDARIEAEQGRSIAEIFATDGESAFRMLERETTLASLKSDAVVSLGGGAVMTPAIAEALVKPVVVVWLQIDPADAAARLTDDESRPLLARSERVKALEGLLAARGPVYAALASTTVRAGDGSIDDIASSIAQEIKGS